MSDDNLSYISNISNEDDIISYFLDHHTINIIYMYQDLKQRFNAFSPFFLANLKSTHLTDFFITILYYKDTLQYQNPPLIIPFVKEYQNEIDISFNIVQTFLKSCKYNLNYNSWCHFCYYKSNLSELYI